MDYLRRMRREYYPVLAGSTLFFTVLRLKKSRTGSQEECFKDFLSIIDPSAVAGIDGSSLHKYASDCKNAKKLPEDGDYVRFGNQDVCAAFKDEIKNNPDAVIDRMKSFVKKYFADNSHALFVKALLELIEQDKSITEHNRPLFVNPGFIPSYKEELLSDISEICIYNFLIGVWYYVYCYPCDNDDERDTIDNWTDKTKDFMPNKVTVVLGCSGKYDNVNISYSTEVVQHEDITITPTGESTVAFVTEEGVVPDLSKLRGNGEGVYFLEATPVKQSEDRFSIYVEKSKNKYSYKKTFLYETERKFKDFYVCNNVCRRLRSPISFANGESGGNKKLARPESNITIEKINEHYIAIVGNGGLGKSMMMNKFFLEEAEKYDVGGRVPIIITLRSYKPDEKSIEYLLTNELKRFDPKLQLADLYYLLENGRVLCLFDGLDEIKKEYISDFQDELDTIKDGYSNCIFVVSSRDIPEVRTLDNFITFELQCFEDYQAYEMIERLDPQVVDKELKDSFITDLKRDRFRLNRDERKSFMGNPLFLTIMLVTYAKTNDIPKKRYLFYEKAYSAMASEYDAKTKRITRPFFTGYDEKTFQKYFAQFCANSYADSNFEFEKDLLEQYFLQVIEDNNLKVTPEQFIKDATEKLCLMYKDGETYCFIHRSFQEYFAAFCFITMFDSDFDMVYQTLMHLDQKIQKDEILSMLYGMDQGRMEKLIILPFLDEMFGFNNDDEDYKCFIKTYYPTIEYPTDDLEEDMCNCEPSSAMYNFILKNYAYIDEPEFRTDFENCMDYADDSERYYYMDEEWFGPYGNMGNVRIITESEVPWRYREEHGEDYDELEGGFICTVYAEKILDDPSFNETAYEILMDKNCSLWKTYQSFKDLHDDLTQKYDESAKPKVRRFGLK